MPHTTYCSNNSTTYTLLIYTQRLAPALTLLFWGTNAANLRDLGTF